MASCNLLLRLLIMQGVAITLIFGAPAQFEATLDNKSSGGVHPEQVIHLGTVDGKSFFLDNTVKMTWEEARAYCLSHKMELASVQTAAQTEMIVKAILDSAYLPHMASAADIWTSGVYRPPPSDVTWYGTNQKPDPAALVKWSGFRNNIHCLRLYVNISGRYYNYALGECQLKFFPLCAAS